MADEAGSPLESPLPPAILRGIGDRSYEKRKAAALEVTSLIKSLQENGEMDRIGAVITLLAQEFARSRNVNHRKGGLIGLAASAIGLVVDIDRYLHLLIPPVLDCFDDPESRVCYYACESLYNISKVARTGVLKYFNQIFDGLCKVSVGALRPSTVCTNFFICSFSLTSMSTLRTAPTYWIAL
jgi:vacuole morphology and inheritance protein 14